MITVDLEDLQKYEKIISDTQAPIADRVDSLFCIKAFDDIEAVNALIRSFHSEKNSELLQHEICYCLGQMDKSPQHISKIQEFLETVIDEKNGYKEIVVHEAVEALGNMSQEKSKQLLDKYSNSNFENSQMLYETCFLAIELIKWKEQTNNGQTEKLNFHKLNFKTNDPAPPFNVYDGTQFEIEKNRDVDYLRSILINKDSKGNILNYNLFERYRAMFTLREINSKESLIAIAQSLEKEHMDQCGALLKHEVAYVIAQMEDVNEHSVPYLLDSVLNDDEAPIVRHEALIALGEITDDKDILQHLLNHKAEIVRESCQVALRNIENRLAEQEWMKEREIDQ